MSRSLLLVAFLALLVPAAGAAPPDPDVTLTVTNVPAQVDAVDQVTVPVTLEVTVSPVACVPGPGTLIVTLAGTFAPSGNTTGNLTIDAIAPQSFRMPQVGAQPMAETRQLPVTLRATGPISGVVSLTAAVQDLVGCTGMNAAGTSAPATFQANFKPASDTTTDLDAGSEVTPGFEVPLLMVALGALAIALRRKA